MFGSMTANKRILEPQVAVSSNSARHFRRGNDKSGSHLNYSECINISFEMLSGSWMGEWVTLTNLCCKGFTSELNK